ncbi:MAG TPA: asparagine synthase (glutamine-hydrolyzing) [Myxococcota bacterium]|nr:asparagine synthase (glutamine-hydrolyzing) [Myxococcota bacterium]
MCGLCGIVGPSRTAGLEDLGPMTRALDHRGPDDSGTWTERFRGPDDAEWTIGFGHTRLAIVDLSPLGHQPMASADGLVTVTYNGEIYNFRELRKELADLGATFRSDCDTEVLVEGYRLLGERIFPRLVGMFAMALWDAPARRLLLVRDRLGIKPLYYAEQPGSLTFASELGSLRRHRGFRAEIDRESLGTFLRSGFVHGERSIYTGVRRVLPGEIVTWEAGRLSRAKFWNLLDRAEGEPPASFEAVVDRLEVLLGRAVERRLIADVPLGAFLSGGIDSTAVVALMQERSARPVKTFSIGFRERGYDEAPFASAVAAHLRTDHTELYVDREQALAVVHELPDLFDEPFADSSAIPTVLLSRLTRRHVTVALSGDGGDELFAGYGWYPKLAKLERLHALPAPLRAALAGFARRLPASALRNGLAHLRARDACELTASLLCHFDPAAIRAACGAAGGAVPPLYRRAFDGAPTTDIVRRAMFADVASYLPDDILTKVDRASMSVALEARVPILDHEVVRYALSLPREIQWHGGRTKAPLRALVHRRVPAALVERPKQGFGIPIESLLATELRDWPKRYLSAERLAEAGHFDPAGAELLTHAALAPDAPKEQVWYLLCFQRWFARVHGGERRA